MPAAAPAADPIRNECLRHRSAVTVCAVVLPKELTQRIDDRARTHGGWQAGVPATAYVIRNGRLDPEWAITERRTMGIAARAISTMIAASGINDVIRMYI